jgi:hypothetical protein
MLRRILRTRTHEGSFPEMSTPQQRELDRFGLGEVGPPVPRVRPGGSRGEPGASGPVPEANRAGHHPDNEQDKPDPASRRDEGAAS